MIHRMAGEMFYQAISIVGALMVLGAYFAYQRGWMGRADRLYSFLNFAGAGLLTWVALVDRRWGFVLVEGVWSLMSIPPLINPPKTRREEDGGSTDAADPVPAGGGE